MLLTLATIEQIEAFLLKSKCSINEGELRLIPRKKSLEILNKLGISIKDAITMVEELTYRDYYRGPTDERDPKFPSGELWEFGIELEFDEFVDIYVKLKDILNQKKMICLSFHECEYPIIYPYKQITQWRNLN